MDAVFIKKDEENNINISLENIEELLAIMKSGYYISCDQCPPLS
jgi:hypothetical protein